ncbi:hypothetical protein GIY09_10985 [Aerococcaceae bacterium WS4759]|uniref:Uncharacterized protein n=1 Tax=Fundicoccus ignavus TaxID=2664442 RepID=A0A6I2GPE1_9LACT|nr:hypothetical protein [Fundicoccus ignavus]MRI86368.1 hypothetical protein [Fundicoccus ignavus]
MKINQDNFFSMLESKINSDLYLYTDAIDFHSDTMVSEISQYNIDLTELDNMVYSFNSRIPSVSLSHTDIMFDEVAKEYIYLFQINLQTSSFINHYTANIDSSYGEIYECKIKLFNKYSINKKEEMTFEKFLTSVFYKTLKFDEYNYVISDKEFLRTMIKSNIAALENEDYDDFPHYVISSKNDGTGRIEVKGEINRPFDEEFLDYNHFNN